MEFENKEVYFNEFCPKCVHKDKQENESPCDDCLIYGFNVNSHKPVRFEEGVNDNGKNNSGKRTV